MLFVIQSQFALCQLYFRMTNVVFFYCDFLAGYFWYQRWSAEIKRLTINQIPSCVLLLQWTGHNKISLVQWTWSQAQTKHKKTCSTDNMLSSKKWEEKKEEKHHTNRNKISINKTNVLRNLQQEITNQWNETQMQQLPHLHFLCFIEVGLVVNIKHKNTFPHVRDSI